MPAAPLRATSYNLARGLFCKFEKGCPLASLIKFGHDVHGSAYDGKMIVIDEAHNLLDPRDSRNLNLMNLLRTSQGSMIVGFTGTPLWDSTSDCKLLMQAICGASPAFASTTRRGIPGYPQTTTRNFCDGSVLIEQQGLPQPPCPEGPPRSGSMVNISGKTFSRRDGHKFAAVLLNTEVADDGGHYVKVHRQSRRLCPPDCRCCPGCGSFNWHSSYHGWAAVLHMGQLPLPAGCIGGHAAIDVATMDHPSDFDS